MISGRKHTNNTEFGENISNLTMLSVECNKVAQVIHTDSLCEKNKENEGDNYVVGTYLHSLSYVYVTIKPRMNIIAYTC